MRIFHLICTVGSLGNGKFSRPPRLSSKIPLMSYLTPAVTYLVFFEFRLQFFSCSWKLNARFIVCTKSCLNGNVEHFFIYFCVCVVKCQSIHFQHAYSSHCSITRYFFIFLSSMQLILYNSRHAIHIILNIGIIIGHLLPVMGSS